MRLPPCRLGDKDCRDAARLVVLRGPASRNKHDRSGGGRRSTLDELGSQAVEQVDHLPRQPFQIGHALGGLRFAAFRQRDEHVAALAVDVPVRFEQAGERRQPDHRLVGDVVVPAAEPAGMVRAEFRRSELDLP